MRITRPVIQAIAILMTVAIAAPFGFGLTPGMVLASANGAYLNAAPAAVGLVARPGDLLCTASAGSARLNLPAGSVQFGARTLARVESRGLYLNRGYLRVRGSVPVSMRAHQLIPAPASLFEVTRLSSGLTYVSVRRGSVTISGFAHPIAVAAGTSARFDQAQAAGAAGAGAATAGTGAAVGIALAVGIAAAAAVATGLIVHAATVCSGCVASPVTP